MTLLLFEECLVRETATEVISIVSAASCGLSAIVRGDCREGTGKRRRQVLGWIQGRVLPPTGEHLTGELLHIKAEHVFVPLKRPSGKVCNSTPWHQAFEQQLEHLQSSSPGVPLRNEFPYKLTTVMGIYDFSAGRFWAFFSPFISLKNSSCSRVPSDPSHKLLWVHDRKNKRTNIHSMNPPTIGEIVLASSYPKILWNRYITGLM